MEHHDECHDECDDVNEGRSCEGGNEEAGDRWEGEEGNRGQLELVSLLLLRAERIRVYVPGWKMRVPPKSTFLE